MNIFTQIGIVLAVTAAAFGSGYFKGRSDGRVAQMADTVIAYQKRGNIDHDVNKVDGVGICLELGGVREQCDQLRGLDSTTPGK